MTLYQRMYACKDEKSAKKAWYLAGILEYPIMAFTGVILGMCARVFFPEVESEMGLPLLLKHCLPVGVTGIVIAAYFSAIMSTADSCLMASSGNVVNDFLQRTILKGWSESAVIRTSQIATLVIGIMAVVIAAQFNKVLEVILYAYGFMVAGLFIPTLGAYFWKKSSRGGAIGSMLSGGVTVVFLRSKIIELPNVLNNIGLAPAIYGIFVSGVIFILGSLLFPDKIIENKGSVIDGFR